MRVGPGSGALRGEYRTAGTQVIHACLPVIDLDTDQDLDQHQLIVLPQPDGAVRADGRTAKPDLCFEWPPKRQVLHPGCVFGKRRR